jgi:hypothetical protein
MIAYRFMPPVQVFPWKPFTLNATQFASDCVQSSRFSDSNITFLCFKINTYKSIFVQAIPEGMKTGTRLMFSVTLFNTIMQHI